MSTDLTPWVAVRPKLGMSLMDHLFERLSGKYPGRWAGLFKNEKAVECWRSEWAEAFVKKGISPAEIAHGLDACNDLYDWPPTLPEFLHACRPPVDPESAFREAGRQMARRHADGSDQWSSPLVFWAAIKFGSFDLQHQSWDQAKGRWKRILDELAGQQLDPVPPAPVAELPAPVMSKEAARARLDELKKMMGMRAAHDGNHSGGSVQDSGHHA